MRKLSFLAVTAIVMMGIAFTSCDSKKSVNFKTEIDSVSYLIGANYGQGLREQSKQFPGDPINMDALLTGFVNAVKGDSIHLGMEIQAVGMFLNNYFQAAQTRAAEVLQEEANKFLAENKTKSGVITTESGLQYKVITEGTGPKPTLTDEIKAHYHLTYSNGEVVESSVQRGEPIEMPVSGFIEGWKEGLQLMPVGSKYIFWVSPELGYNPSGPNHPLYGKLLVFEVELLDIKK